MCSDRVTCFNWTAALFGILYLQLCLTSDARDRPEHKDTASCALHRLHGCLVYLVLCLFVELHDTNNSKKYKRKTIISIIIDIATSAKLRVDKIELGL